MRQMFASILVAISGSEASLGAFQYALSMKKQFGSKVTACYIVDTATIRQLALSRIFVPDESQEYEDSLELSGKRYLNFCVELASKKRMTIETVLGKGSVPGEIVKTASDLGVDCIILGGQPDEHQYKDVVLEANREILKHARCPVVFVKPGMGEDLYRSL
ncbi:MAG: universal stress protein [Spirochaetes bacterium]|nr:universal stress protein [Spirochaetota bacterium]